MIRLAHVEVSEEAKDHVVYLLNDGKIGQSEIIEEFEQAFAKWAGSRYAVAVCNGTMADTLALAALKHFNPGKVIVIVPALTFAAHVNSIIYNGLIPVFVDVGQDFQIYASACESVMSKAVLCMFPVHLLGKPFDVLSMNQLSKATGVPFIEDSCEAMGSAYNYALTGLKKCGTFGAMGTYSFFPSHTITTGEGGVIVTDDKDYADLLRRLRNHGKTSQADFHFDVVGFNAKMTSIQAALGLYALNDIEEVIKKRREAYFALGGKEDERNEFITPHGVPFMAKDKDSRDAMLERLRKLGVECRNIFSSLPTQEKAYQYLGYKLGDFPIAEDVGNRGFYVPCHQGLSEDDIKLIKGVLDN